VSFVSNSGFSAVTNVNWGVTGVLAVVFYTLAVFLVARTVHLLYVEFNQKTPDL